MPKSDTTVTAAHDNLWFDDVFNRRLEGRYIDTEIDDPLTGGKKSTLAIEIRVRSASAGNRDSNCTMIKPRNEDEMKQRFPAAWAHYEAAKSGKPIAREIKTEIPWGILGQAQMARLAQEGYDSLERVLAASNHELVAILGPRGPDLRDQIKVESEKKSKAVDFAAPSSTPIEIKGPIDAMTLMILRSRSIMILEELAGIRDENLWSLLGAKGEECREFARQELRNRQTPLVPAESLDPATIAELRARGIVSFEQLRQLNRAKAGRRMLDIRVAELVGIAERYLAQTPRIAPGPDTSVEALDFIPASKKAFLRELGFSTAKHFAQMSDAAISGLGKDAKAWRTKARDLLSYGKAPA